MITFTTKNWYPLTYLQAQGEQMLQMMGCTPYDNNTGRGGNAAKAEGIVQVGAVSDALALLQQHSDGDAQAALQTDAADNSSLTGHIAPVLQQESQISLAARTFPLLQLLQAAQAASQPVIWRHSTHS